jgi:hypothetical protein
MEQLEFIFAGFLIVARIDVLAATPEDMSYRGVDRTLVSASYRNPDGTAPEGWLGAVCRELRAVEDVFEFIPAAGDVERVFAEVDRNDTSYEVLACGIEPAALDHLFTQRIEDLIPIPAPHPKYVGPFLQARDRLNSRTRVPPGKLLGYDVAFFGQGSYSLVFR